MSTRFDLGDLSTRVNRAAGANTRVRRKVVGVLRKVTFDTVRLTKNMMPKDTGRARASWGVWSPSDVTKPNPDANAEDAILIDNADTGLFTTQGTNVPYVEMLNRGSSPVRTKAKVRGKVVQGRFGAPAGFIDMAADTAQDALDRIVAEIVDEVIQ